MSLDPTRVQAVERAIDVLMSLRSGAKTLTEVGRATGLSKGTSFRLLATLSYQGFVAKDPERNTYMLGPGCLTLLQGSVDGLGSVMALARPALVRLWQATGETVAVHVRVGTDRICVGEIPSPHPVRYTAEVGAAIPIHVGAAGKAMLAALPDADLERILKGNVLTGLTDRTITSTTALRKELDAIRRAGYATSSGERAIGASAVSIAVRGPQELLASVSILAPSDRLPKVKIVEHLPQLRQTAAEIVEALAPIDQSRRLDGAEKAKR